MIPIQVFTADLWEAMRGEVREQLHSLPDDEFLAVFPSWEKLPPDVQETKIRIARDELLAVLDRAGYQVRRKKALAQNDAEV
jgi:hypothetical protein